MSPPTKSPERLADLAQAPLVFSLPTARKASRAPLSWGKLSRSLARGSWPAALALAAAWSPTLPLLCIWPELPAKS